jgi:hypothetical protein
MKYVFIDESGDLGFNFNHQKTSRYFIITALLIDKKNSIEKLIKKIFRSFPKKERMSHSGILHAYKETSKTKFKLLKSFVEKNQGFIITIYLDKKSFHLSKFHNDKHIFYNYITNTLLNRVYQRDPPSLEEKIQIIASRRETNKFININFIKYISQKGLLYYKKEVEVLITTPSKEKTLQVVDMLCWAIFRKYEHGDDSYYSIIQSMIIDERSFFKEDFAKQNPWRF